MTHQIINFFFISLFLILSQILTAQNINSLRFEGAASFSQKDYLGWANVSQGVIYFEGITDSIKNRIGTALTERAYFNFSFDSSQVDFSVDSQSVDINIFISEGTPTTIKNIFYNSLQGADSSVVSASFEFLIGNYFYEYEFEEAVAEILNHYEENGYPFISIKTESIYFHTDSLDQKPLVDIHLNINKGLESRINKVEIAGNDKTKDYVILRAIGLHEDEQYSFDRISEVPKKLNRLRFFEPVETPSFYFNSNDEGILKITIKEKRTNNFDGIVGYVPDTREGESGYFIGFININLRNIFGTGRAAGIKWQREDRLSQELELKYLEPWLFGFPFNLNFGLFQRKQDTTYVQRKFNGSIEYMAAEDITASVLLATEETIPTESDFTGFTVFNSNSFTTGLNLNINTTDDFYAPTSGMIFNNTYLFTQKKINGPEEFITPTTKTDINLQRIEVDFAFLYEIFSRQVTALLIHGRELKGSSFDLSDLYRLGGTYSLRGYREKQFSGNRIFWSNLEYRYLLSKRSYALLFFDTGYYLRNEDLERDVTRVEGFKIGYGLGLNIETGIGVLGVNFAIAKGDSFADGKIHFGILNEF